MAPCALIPLRKNANLTITSEKTNITMTQTTTAFGESGMTNLCNLPPIKSMPFRSRFIAPCFQFHRTILLKSRKSTKGDLRKRRKTCCEPSSTPTILFGRRGQNWGGLRPAIFQQIDIMPSVLGYLRYDKPYVSFGRDCWNKATPPFAFNYLNNTYQAFAGRYFLLFNGKESTGLYNFAEDKMLEKNLLAVLPDTAKRMEYKLKAFIQQYNNRMIDNRWTEGAK